MTAAKASVVIHYGVLTYVTIVKEIERLRVLLLDTSLNLMIKIGFMWLFYANDLIRNMPENTISEGTCDILKFNLN